LNPIAPAIAAVGPNQGQPAQDLAAELLAAVQNQRLLMEQTLMRLGISEVADREFTNNGINSLQHLHMLSEDGLDHLIKQIHRDNQGAGLFTPFFSQESVFAIHFWTNRMYILGLSEKEAVKTSSRSRFSKTA
jgi:hypothetical protein